jgi:hypothetical protein
MLYENKEERVMVHYTKTGRDYNVISQLIVDATMVQVEALCREFDLLALLWKRFPYFEDMQSSLALSTESVAHEEYQSYQYFWACLYSIFSLQAIHRRNVHFYDHCVIEETHCVSRAEREKVLSDIQTKSKGFWVKSGSAYNMFVPLSKDKTLILQSCTFTSPIPVPVWLFRMVTVRIIPGVVEKLKEISEFCRNRKDAWQERIASDRTGIYEQYDQFMATQTYSTQLHELVRSGELFLFKPLLALD